MLLKLLPSLQKTRVGGVDIKHRSWGFGGSAIIIFVQKPEFLLFKFHIYSTAGYVVTLKPQTNTYFFNPKLNGKTACIESNKV